MAIVLTQSLTDCINPLIIRAKLTSHMMAITSNKIYCFYPQLAIDKKTLKGVDPINNDVSVCVSQRGLELLLDTGTWLGPCGYACPKLVRNTHGLHGVGVFTLKSASNTSYVSFADSISDESMQQYCWRLGDRCRNTYCQRFI